MKRLIGITMNVYLSYASYRRRVIDEVGGILNLRKTVDNDTEEEEES